MVVALAVFALGGGASIYEGVSHVLKPRALDHLGVTYAVLACSAVFEGYSLYVAMREFQRTRGTLTIVQAIKRSKDPASFTVLFEDSTAVLGIALAFAATALTQVYGFKVLDGCASIGIGLLLMSVAVLLGAKTKNLLIGEGLDRETLGQIRQIAEGVHGVVRLGYPFTMFFGPHTALLTMSIQFNRDFSSKQVEFTVDRIESLIQAAHPDLKHIFIEVDTVSESGRGAKSETSPLPEKGVATGT